MYIWWYSLLTSNYIFADNPLSMMGIAWILLTESPHKASDRWVGRRDPAGSGDELERTVLQGEWVVGIASPKKDPKSEIYIEFITTLGLDCTNFHHFHLFELYYICKNCCVAPSSKYQAIQTWSSIKIEPISKQLGMLGCLGHWIWAKHWMEGSLTGRPFNDTDTR